MPTPTATPTVMTTTTDQFPDHVAGDPYCLNREEFIRFAGLQEDYDAFLKVLQQKAASGRLPGNGHNYEPECQAFWAAIASFEAMRRFHSDSDCCDSWFCMEASRDAAGSCKLEYRYESTSGTTFTALECRKYNGPASEFEPVTLPEPMFVVCIPDTRDMAGRTHYEALRRGGSYRDF
jgi:hypothetical protein